jgi:2-amino-4-hydroxy-6-hydroxymethyldihydropteridine diphosphokinase
MATAFVGLGSNLVHPRRQIARALRALSRLPRTRVVRVSPSFATAPVGAPGPQPDYVNAVAMLSTALTPRALLARLHAIERRQGRRRSARMQRNSARTLDLDLLLFGRRRQATAELELPHPRMHQRAFVLRPLARIAPAVTIPGRGLARGHLRDVRGQAAFVTRTHHLL